MNHDDRLDRRTDDGQQARRSSTLGRRTGRQGALRLGGTQQGSFYSMIMIAIMFGILLIAGLKIAPAYLDNNVVKNAMEGIDANNDMKQMSIAEIRSSVMRTLNTNNVDFDAGNINFTQQAGTEYVEIIWERRVPLFYNISAVVSFNDRYERK